MRKAYSPEIENQAVSKYLLGYPVREIGESVGVSVGYVSNCIENFTAKMEKGEINAVHEFFKILRKTGLTPKDAFLGYAVFSVISKYKLDADKINDFAESVLLFAKENELSAEELVGLCKKLSDIQSACDVSLEELDSYCNDLVSKKKQLEENVSQLELQCKQSQTNLSNVLDKNNLVAKQVEMTVQVLASLTFLGLDVSDLNSFSNAIQNAKAKKYNVSEIITCLNQNKSLDSVLEEKQSMLDNIEAKTEKSAKLHDDLLLRNENLAYKYNSMLESIKSVKYLAKKGVSKEVISDWQQIFDSFGISPDEFLRNLKEIGGKNMLNSDLDNKKESFVTEIESLEKKKSWLEGNVRDLTAEISNRVEFGTKSLKKITEKTESQIDHAITHTTKSFDDSIKHNQNQIKIMQKYVEGYFSELTLKFETLFGEYHNAMHDIGDLDSLKPLRSLTRGNFDPITAIPQILGILDVLSVNVPGSNLDGSILRSDIKRLREKLLKVFNHE